MDNDERNFSKTLKEQEIKSWLKSHKPEVFKKYHTRHVEDLYHKKLLQGLRTEKEPEEQLELILQFSSPIKKNGKVSDNRKAAEHVLKLDTNRNRYNSGVNLSTLITEHRRKVILKALTSAGNIHESKSEARNLLDQYLKTTSATNDAENIDNETSEKHLTSPVRRLSPLKSLSVVHDAVNKREENKAQFAPKWEHYDSMKTRWAYIQPQTKRLECTNAFIVPISDQKQMRVDDRILCGSLEDVARFSEVAQKGAHRTMNVKMHSTRLTEEKRAKDSIAYVPTHSVRY